MQGFQQPGMNGMAGMAPQQPSMTFN